MIIYGYEKTCFLKTIITPTKKIHSGTSYTLEGTLSWLACRESCIPGNTPLALVLPSNPEKNESNTIFYSLIKEAFWASPEKPPFTFSLIAQGRNRVLQVENSKESHYELFPTPPSDIKVGEVITKVLPQGYNFEIPWNNDLPFRGLLVATTEEGTRKGWWISSADSTFQNSSTSLKEPSPSIRDRVWSPLFIALVFGFLGGLLLNLMPCVLPVISLKIFGFVTQAHQNCAKIFYHGLAFIAGIYGWFLALGGVILLLKMSGREVTWAFQFQNDLFLLIVNALVFLFALNLFGVFEFTLSSAASNSLDQLSSKEGYLGSFFQGLFATLLATPCTAPFLGSALGFAFAQSGLIILVVFLSIATGMALPFFLLSWNPSWVKWLPPRGPWMEHLKQFMGFPLIATNIWLLGVLSKQHGSHGILLTLLLLLSLGISAWIYGAFSTAQKNIRRGALVISLLLILSSSWGIIPNILSTSLLSVETEKEGAVINNDSIEWVPYSATHLASLRKEGKPVFLDFTAAWCLTCQFNERTAINTPVVRALLRQHDITPMKADWTNANPEITQALKAFHRVGVPYYVYYPAGVTSQPIEFSELLFESSLVKAFSGK